ncbi:hypothetical protein EG328_007242 [Venturia inaequalis]|uniref:MOSC domain-containing protein n=1 Tax=Venturia inaequalis TaxID=5025 RepID=A0A8H3VBM1_VENIN|nr:hypothetical protein EG328_007242 [Venturia inaequalis]KAE9994187.1 hypothetical protein EG327_000894 [Venturia inaequalis]
MSCPAKQHSIPPTDFEADPMIIFYTLGFTAIVIVVSLGYRKLWTAYWDHRIGPLGMRRVGKPGDRNLSKEFAKEYQKSEKKIVGKDEWRVEALFDHPIKSTYPIEVQESVVEAHGLEHDRQFCFAQWYEPTPKGGQEVNTTPKEEPEKGTTSWWNKRRHWTCLTQRKTPRLTLVKTEIWVPDPQSRDYDDEDEYIKSGGCLVVKFPFTPSLNPLNVWSVFVTRLVTWNWKSELTVTFRVPLNPTAERIRERGYTNDNFNIFRDYPSGLDMTSEISSKIWDQFRYTLDVSKIKPGLSNRLALFRVDLTKNRNLYKCAPNEEQLGYQARLSFQDSYPLSIQNMSSIMTTETECSHGQQPTKYTPDSRRYRGNIYISGPAPFDEDDWTLIQIGDHKYHVSCRTTRCTLPTNDPNTGILSTKVQPEPQKWLLANRKIDAGNKVGCLGMQMVPTKEAIGSVIRVGDVVKVLKRGHHLYVQNADPEFQRPVL